MPAARKAKPKPRKRSPPSPYTALPVLQRDREKQIETGCGLLDNCAAVSVRYKQPGVHARTVTFRGKGSGPKADTAVRSMLAFFRNLVK